MINACNNPVSKNPALKNFSQLINDALIDPNDVAFDNKKDTLAFAYDPPLLLTEKNGNIHLHWKNENEWRKIKLHQDETGRNYTVEVSLMDIDKEVGNEIIVKELFNGPLSSEGTSLENMLLIFSPRLEKVLFHDTYFFWEDNCNRNGPCDFKSHCELEVNFKKDNHVMQIKKIEGNHCDSLSALVGNYAMLSGTLTKID